MSNFTDMLNCIEESHEIAMSTYRARRSSTGPLVDHIVTECTACQVKLTAWETS